MAYRVDLTVRAARDLESIYEYINAEESAAAAAWFNGFEAAIYRLERFPQRCPAAPESRKAKKALRHLLYGRKPHVYRVIYEITQSEGRVMILTVRHGARRSAQPDELA